jgi:hypothetical protein
MEFTGEGNYVNCSDEDPEEVKVKDQGFDKAAEKIVNISDNSKNGLNLDQLTFKDLFNSNYVDNYHNCDSHIYNNSIHHLLLL